MPRRKRTLVIEGGGMKGAYANGVLSAFEEAGVGPWDMIVGTSAGGALGAWYAAGQARYAEATWDYARDPRVLSYWRALSRRGPLLDHEALLEIVYRQEHPLDVDAVARFGSPVIVTAVDVETGVCHYVDIRDKDVIAWLKATGRLPFGSNGPVNIDGRSYLDGGVVDPVPIRYAVEDMGARDVTLILNNADRRRRPDPRFVLEVAGRRYEALRDGIVHHQDIKLSSYNYALAPPDGVRVEVIRPATPTGLSRMSRDLTAIRAAIEQGRQDGLRHAQARP